MLKRRIEKMEIVPCTQIKLGTVIKDGKGLYSLYVNGELELHASAEYMADVVKEYLLNSQNENRTTPSMNIYEIWATGFADNGCSGRAFCFGTEKGKDFKDACRNFTKVNAEFKKYFDEKRMTWWGCSLFDNEAEARKSFG